MLKIVSDILSHEIDWTSPFNRIRICLRIFSSRYLFLPILLWFHVRKTSSLVLSLLSAIILLFRIGIKLFCVFLKAVTLWKKWLSRRETILLLSINFILKVGIDFTPCCVMKFEKRNASLQLIQKFRQEIRNV